MTMLPVRHAIGRRLEREMFFWKTAGKEVTDMASLFGILAIFCLVYYGVIIFYSGAGTSLSVIWLIFAAVFAAIGVLVHFYRLFRHKIPLRLEVSVITIFLAVITIFLSVEVAMGFNFFSLKKQSTDYVIVLGYQVQDGEVSKTLEHRLDKAYEYAKVHPNTVFILSGGKNGGEELSEAEVMYDYLKKRGVPEYQMIKEEQSSSTYENLVYSKMIIDEREKNRRGWIKDLMSRSGYLSPPDEEVTIRVGIVTSNFHVLRAKRIAKHVGIQHVSGIAAKSDPVLFLHLCVRECLAILKDKFVGNM